MADQLKPWKRLNELKKQRPQEQRRRGFSDAEAESYYRTMERVYLHLLNTEADAVLIPLRGAEPLLRAVQLFASLNKKSDKLPRAYFLKIGERVVPYGADLPKGRLPEKFGEVIGALPYPEQKRRIKEALAKIGARVERRPLKVVLLDEVIYGKSILKQQDHIHEAAGELGLDVDLHTIAVSEEKREKTEEFKLRARLGGIRVFRVKTLIASDFFRFLVQQVQLPVGERLSMLRHSPKLRIRLLSELQRRFVTNKAKPIRKVKRKRRSRPKQPTR